MSNQESASQRLDAGKELEHVCRCGHGRDDHQSKSWQERGEKFYGQVCQHCPCKSYLQKGGPLDTLVESFRHRNDQVAALDHGRSSETVEQLKFSLRQRVADYADAVASEKPVENVWARYCAAEDELIAVVRAASQAGRFSAQEQPKDHSNTCGADKGAQ